MAKMKLAQSSEHAPTFLQPTGKKQSPASVASISFLDATHPNFLNVFLMRPIKIKRPMFIIR